MMKEEPSSSVDWEEISKNINNALLIAKCEAGDLGEPLEKYFSDNRILLQDEKNKIKENRFAISDSGELKFSEIFSCLGIILIDQEKKVALAAHITPIIDDNIEKVCNNYLKQFDDIYKMNVTKVVLVSSRLGEEEYFSKMEKLIREKYKTDNIEHYKELTVSYNIDSDTVSKAKVTY